MNISQFEGGLFYWLDFLLILIIIMFLMLLLSILFIIMFIHGKKFDNVNGIYKNGIIASSDK